MLSLITPFDNTKRLINFSGEIESKINFNISVIFDMHLFPKPDILESFKSITLILI